MHSFDITIETFSTDVIEASQNSLILVDFWATWCGPCKSLMPVLEKLAEEYNGKFKLAKVNVDEQQQLAQHFAVRSVPTVKMIKNAQIVDEFTGALPETEIRALIEKHFKRESDTLMAAALEKYNNGDQDAIQEMINIINADPENNQIRLQYIDVLVKEKKSDDAKQLLDSLPADIKEQAEVKSLLNRIDIMSSAQEFGDINTLKQIVEQEPDNLEARQNLSNLYIANGDFESALEQLFEIMRRDRQYEDDLGHKNMLKVFDMLGGQGELVSRYRRKMASLLF